MTVAGHKVDQVTLDGRELQYQQARFKGEAVQVVKFPWDLTFAEVVVNKAVLAVLKQAKPFFASIWPIRHWTD